MSFNIDFATMKTEHNVNLTMPSNATDWAYWYVDIPAGKTPLFATFTRTSDQAVVLSAPVINGNSCRVRIRSTNQAAGFNLTGTMKIYWG